MKAKTISDFLKHFNDKELNEMRVKVSGSALKSNLNVISISAKCLERWGSAFGTPEFEQEITIVVD